MAPCSPTRNPQPAGERSADQAMEESDILKTVNRASASNRSLRYGCDLCTETFRRRDERDRHRFTHTGLHEFPCLEPSCGKAYTNRSHLLRHIRASHIEHDDKKQVDCKHTSCRMKFANKQTMKRHYKAKHVVGKPYACDECRERFWRKLQLKRHKIRHTGQYPHRCTHCSQGFVNLRTMRDHRCKRNAQCCTACGWTCERWSELVVHRRLEHPTPFRCEQCDKQFHTRRNLNMHQRVHLTAEHRNVYECPYEGCPRFYEHERNLYAHVRSKHEGRQREELVCPVDGCGRVLASKQKLEQHRKLHQSATKAALRLTRAHATPCETANEPMAVPNVPLIEEPMAIPNVPIVEGPISVSTLPEVSETPLPPQPDASEERDITTDSDVDISMPVPNLLSVQLNQLIRKIDELRSSLATI